uniref:Ig-like domain-containing protein n=2 Tax=Canis lupus familiaris TaxID=9615 RepID=A0A8C0PIA3_CANLF
MLLLTHVILVTSLWSYTKADTLITQLMPSVIKKQGNTAFLECQIKTGAFKKNVYIHWYRQKPDQPLQRILYISSNENVVHEQGVSEERYEARKWKQDLPASLRIHRVNEADAGLYYCACWDNSGWIKIFGEGTKLIVTPSDRNLNVGTSPKPTIFLPSIAETTLHNAGTYLCLLENFFPDVIKIDWKEKNDKTVLKSQQGDTIKTYDTYMKFSWLTVTGVSVNKEYKCIIKHERNKGGVEQEILFPSQKKELTAITSAKPSMRYEDDVLQLQLMNTSAYYIYLLLLLKSLAYSVAITFYLLGDQHSVAMGRVP